MRRFAPDSEILHVRETAEKHVLVDKTRLQTLGIGGAACCRLPDVVVYSASRKRLFLIDAVTSLPALAPQRLQDLRRLKNAWK